MTRLAHLGIKTFGQKFFASYVLLLILFLALIFPLVAKSVQHIVFLSMNNRIDSLIEKLKSAPSEPELIQLLKKQKNYEFFRIGLLDNKMYLLYDTHTKRLRGPFFYPLQFSSHPEMQQASRTGSGYCEQYSQVLEQKMIYLARRFDFHGKPYYLRLALPYQYIQDLRHNFEIGFILVSSLVLLLFSAMSSFVLHRMSRPIKEIIRAIGPYQKESRVFFPTIQLQGSCHEEFRQLADTINSLSKRLQRQIEALKEFTANASHELKTPITIIKGFVETLVENPHLPEETVNAVASRIASNCTRMTKTVQNLLTLSNVEHLAQSRLKSCNLIDIVTCCKKCVHELYPHATIALAYAEHESFELTADPELLEVALTNLLDNAAKYAKDTPYIQIRLKKGPKQVLIEIEDNGIGIAEKDLECIFQRFYRVAGHDRMRKGTGLGLSIVQTIAEKHYGTVCVQSELAKGSVFTMSIADDIDKRVQSMVEIESD